jgi:8-oxo-dGTP pyrophosphatase MutT (NUDIX family)
MGRSRKFEALFQRLKPGAGLKTRPQRGCFLIAVAVVSNVTLEVAKITQETRRNAPAEFKKSDADGLRQVAAVPLRFGERGTPEVLLVTSRETQRWVIPKGWPMKGRKRHEAAAQEAFEEAGVTGKIEKAAIGSYEYFKRREVTFDLCKVEVFILAVEKQAKTWPEQHERRANWFGLEEAAALVDEPGLSAVLLDLAENLASKS